ncbi:MAG TPA: hypothetical protein VHF01_19350 [Candidatus Acidoferrum sp.]|nr:hypothetical protein [Candidatus Acidoferrum sp.]
MLSSTAGVTSLSVTMTGNGSTQFAVFEVASTSGVFTFDAQGSATNGSGFTQNGIGLSLTGSNDAIFQSAFVPGGTSSVSLYPQPRVPGQDTMFFTNEAGAAVLLNTTNGTAPKWVDQQNQGAIVTGIAFRTGTGTAPAPPTGLAAVVN